MPSDDEQAGAPQPAHPRRIIAARDEHGHAVYAEVGPAPRLSVGGPFTTWAIWGSDAPELGNAVQPWQRTLFPPAGGVRFFISDIPPEEGEVDITTRMHSSETIDFALILAGKVHMTQGDGTDLALGPGDCLVQAGTVHAWHNPGPETARIAFVLLGVAHEPC